MICFMCQDNQRNPLLNVHYIMVCGVRLMVSLRIHIVLCFYDDNVLTHTHHTIQIIILEMIFMMLLKDDKHSKELMSLGFPETLFATHDYCEKLLKHCTTYDMVFLKGSYGTIVNKDFHKHFKRISDIEGKEQLFPHGDLSDHTNLLQTRKGKPIHIVTSSPYTFLDEKLWEQLKEYPYNAYTINPKLLDYIHFAYESYGDIREPLMFINYAFTDATPQQMMDLNNSILLDTGIYASFMPLKILSEMK